jgi:hypothetical protein
MKRSIPMIAERSYTVLLLLYPEEFRRRFGPAMVEVFRTQWEHLTRRHGSRILVAIVVRTLADILRTAPRQRLVSAGRAMAERLKKAWDVFGHHHSPKQSRGEAGPKGLIGSVFQDARFGLRTLRRRPLYTTVAALTLGLGIGAATAMFSVVHGVLLEELSYREPARLVTVWLSFPWKEVGGGSRAWNTVNLRDDQYRDLREHNTLFQDE